MKRASIGTEKGILFFYIHFIIEVVSFYILSQYLTVAEAGIIAFIYDFLAFVPQGIFGYVFDENLKYPGLILGVAFAIVALCLLYTKVHPYVIIVVIAIASCFIHETGAEHTLRDGNGRMTPAALFVSGGSFGLITGKLLARFNVPVWAIILIALTMLVPLFYFRHHPLNLEKTCEEYHFADKNLNPILVVVLATVVVTVRSFIGYGIPTSWNKELYQNILLYVFMGLGKALGGILIDTIGIKWVSVISTIGALPFLIWGDNIMILSIIGVMFFSMTMAITLALIVSVMKKHPGIGFGMTTIGLFLGTLPLFIFKIEDKTINILLIVVLTIVSLVLLLILSEKKNKSVSETDVKEESIYE